MGGAPQPTLGREHPGKDEEAWRVGHQAALVSPRV